MTDFHSHILPGVDDGIQTMEESLEALSYMENLGITTLWLTPHIMEDYPNKTADLKKIFQKLKKEYNGKMELHLAAENMLDSVFVERLETKDFLPIGEKQDMLLVETSFFNPPTGIFNLLSAIKSAGLFPMLAHPERYTYMNDDDYMELFDFGVRFQVNLISLTGAYGHTAQKKVRKFIEKGMVYGYGSDLHKLSSFDNVIHTKY